MICQVRAVKYPPSILVSILAVPSPPPGPHHPTIECAGAGCTVTTVFGDRKREVYSVYARTLAPQRGHSTMHYLKGLELEAAGCVALGLGPVCGLAWVAQAWLPVGGGSFDVVCQGARPKQVRTQDFQKWMLIWLQPESEGTGFD